MVSGTNDSKNTPPIVSLAAGGVAGGIEAFTSYPFEFAKTRVQLRSEKGIPTPKNPFKVVTQVYQSEGLRALYKGCGALVVGSIAKDGVRFLFFDQIKIAFADPQTGTLSPLRNLAAGMTAGVVASITAVTPTERIKTALIDDARNERRFRSGLHATQVIYREHGISGLYRGFAGTTLKQASATAFRMGTYNILKDFETKRDIPQTTVTNFANGSVAGTVTTLCTQPFDVIKTRSQSAHGASTIEAIKSILADYGFFRGFWKGTTMRLGRTVFSGGILFTSYEAAVKVIQPLYSGLTHTVGAQETA
ncbi:tricarboxylate transport protein-like protein [Aaosphaeria arxii CBS 175.79]|uniref:Tricarboxylate transport protein-like protein n=1 Tax=Aaosphaeria arxii CBS 175.79 TaxID=1450172 RepID=A0A6A5XJW2_9PLEO|nr:tricarboxylate transport protein-like protein [Aaosphaeria arxii CBS 175.79]KAF2013568.1 tricarboxylate transport protein-like protein [Aaosphaeria arxii CBS 175.79]